MSQISRRGWSFTYFTIIWTVDGLNLIKANPWTRPPQKKKKKFVLMKVKRTRKTEPAKGFIFDKEVNDP